MEPHVRKGVFATERTLFFPSYAGGCSSFVADQLNSLFITTTVTGNAICQVVARLSVVRGEAHLTHHYTCFRLCNTGPLIVYGYKSGNIF